MVTPRKSVTDAVDAFLSSLTGLDPVGVARAAIAHTLAVKLEQSEVSDSGAVAQATAGVARELSNTLDALAATQSADDELLRTILGSES